LLDLAYICLRPHPHGATSCPGCPPRHEVSYALSGTRDRSPVGAGIRC
jgi:hypothetical protein